MSRFDVKAAREELARIETRWESMPAAILSGTRDMLGRALDEIDRLTGAADVDGATFAGWSAATGGTAEDFAMLSERGSNNLRASTRAVLAHVGRAESAASRVYRPNYEQAMTLPILEACSRAGFTEERTIAELAKALEASQEQCARLLEVTSPRTSVPVAARHIADADVGAVAMIIRGEYMNDGGYVEQARAVLEWAASRGIGGADAPVFRENERLIGVIAEMEKRLAAPPPDTGRAERLDRCRDRAAQYVAARGVPESWDVTDRAQEIEAQAHAFYAAEMDSQGYDAAFSRRLNDLLARSLCKFTGSTVEQTMSDAHAMIAAEKEPARG